MTGDPTHHGLIAQDEPDRRVRCCAGPLDLVMPVLHGTYGEDGTLQGMLEMAGVAYAGCGVLGASLGMDKEKAKLVFRAAGLPVVDWLVCAANTRWSVTPGRPRPYRGAFPLSRLRQACQTRIERRRRQGEVARGVGVRFADGARIRQQGH